MICTNQHNTHDDMDDRIGGLGNVDGDW
uniref:Uncharacterized protein n=1 Tax=Arundo donax TaxID=35708 RepID=A0A0A9N1A1_ARUDO